MKTLNPFEVTAWVREQFTPDRMEINIVGDFGEGNNMTSFLPNRTSKEHNWILWCKSFKIWSEAGDFSGAFYGK